MHNSVRSVAVGLVLAVLAGACGSSASSTDRTLVAFDLDRSSGPASRQGFDIYVVRQDGRGLRRLTRTRDSMGPAWSPDGRRIAFACGNGHPNGHGGFDICVVRADGSGLRRLTHVAATGGSFDQPAWSPDGKEIAAVCSFDICLVSPRGEVEELTETTSEPLFLGPIWSPDGRSIAVMCPRLGSKDFPTCVVDAVDGSVRTVTRSGRLEGWTPDGELVLSTSRGTSLAPLRLFTVEIDGTRKGPLPASTRVDGPAWSPDGKTFVVSRGRRLFDAGRDDKLVRTLVSMRHGSRPGIPAWQPTQPK